MPFRDFLLFAGFGIMAPLIVVHPSVGALLWVLFGLLNPHRLTYGPAYDFPFAMLIGVLTMIGLVLTRDHRQLKGGPAGFLLIVLYAWTALTTYFALTPEPAVAMFIRVGKVFLMTFVLMAVLHTKRHVHMLLATIVVSIAFYGLKGGLFTILTGGSYMVMGPEGSVMEGNNALGVANVMIIPFFVYGYEFAPKRWMRLAMLVGILLLVAAVLGSYSRGAFLALVSMGFVFWLRSSHRAVTAAFALATVIVLIPFMPERWDARMRTIQTYEAEGSAMGRIYAWHAAVNIANDRFLGGGFEYPTPEVMQRYSPGPYVSVAHSIYFQALGEHGYVGFVLFMAFLLLVWRQCASARKRARDPPDLRWAYSLMSATQASFVGYAVGGAFLNLAFWDMAYYLYAMVVLTAYVIERSRKAAAAASQAKQDAFVTPMTTTSGVGAGSSAPFVHSA